MGAQIAGMGHGGISSSSSVTSSSVSTTGYNMGCYVQLFWFGRCKYMDCAAELYNRRFCEIFSLLAGSRRICSRNSCGINEGIIHAIDSACPDDLMYASKICREVPQCLDSLERPRSICWHNQGNSPPSAVLKPNVRGSWFEKTVPPGALHLHRRSRRLRNWGLYFLDPKLAVSNNLI